MIRGLEIQCRCHILLQGEEDVENYGPISLVLIPREVLEQIILEGISKYIKDMEMTGNHQYGYMKGEILPDQPDSLL